jgi:ribonuclease BN (tRNA processing enzyme)
MRVTVLGKSPSWQDAGGACSGYLVQEGDYSLLLDCGNGVFGKLRAATDYAEVDAVLLSHLHADHCFDVVPFSYSLLVSPRGGRRRPELHAPPGAGEVLGRLSGCLGDEGLIGRAFALREYDPAGSLTLGPFTVRLCEVPHFVLTHAVEITGPDGRRLTFSADCRPNPALEHFAQGTDLLLAEATAVIAEGPVEDRGHLTAGEAGQLARAASARRLVVTHFSDELDRDRIRTEAAGGFGHPVELAAEGAVYTL